MNQVKDRFPLEFALPIPEELTKRGVEQLQLSLPVVGNDRDPGVFDEITVLLLALGLGAWGQCASEVEDNDSAALADYVTELPGNGCITGSIGVVGDIDFYYFDVSSARSVVIETQTNEDTEIALWDANGNPIAQNDDTALNVYSSRIESFLEAGRYVVAVWEHGDDNVIYNYTLSIHAQGCASEVEQNNTFAMADYLGVLPGQVCIAGTIGVVGDFDVFAVVGLDAPDDAHDQAEKTDTETNEHK